MWSRPRDKTTEGVMWCFENAEKGGWTLCDPTISDQLENKYEAFSQWQRDFFSSPSDASAAVCQASPTDVSPHRVVKFYVGDRCYELDLATLEQKNTTTHKLRNMKRTVFPLWCAPFHPRETKDATSGGGKRGTSGRVVLPCEASAFIEYHFWMSRSPFHSSSPLYMGLKGHLQFSFFERCSIAQIPEWEAALPVVKEAISTAQGEGSANAVLKRSYQFKISAGILPEWHHAGVAVPLKPLFPGPKTPSSHQVDSIEGTKTANTSTAPAPTAGGGIHKWFTETHPGGSTPPQGSHDAHSAVKKRGEAGSHSGKALVVKDSLDDDVENHSEKSTYPPTEEDATAAEGGAKAPSLAATMSDGCPTPILGKASPGPALVDTLPSTPKVGSASPPLPPTPPVEEVAAPPAVDSTRGKRGRDTEAASESGVGQSPRKPAVASIVSTFSLTDEHVAKSPNFDANMTLVFPSLSTAIFMFDLHRAAKVLATNVSKFLDSYPLSKHPKLQLVLIDFPALDEEKAQGFTETIKAIFDAWKTLREVTLKKPLDPRFKFRLGDVGKADQRGPAAYIANASNARFAGGPKTGGINRAIYEAAGDADLMADTKARYPKGAVVGPCYDVPLRSTSPLYAQGVRHILHSLGPNMNPKRPNYLEGDYAQGCTLLERCYSQMFESFFELAVGH